MTAVEWGRLGFCTHADLGSAHKLKVSIIVVEISAEKRGPYHHHAATWQDLLLVALKL